MNSPQDVLDCHGLVMYYVRGPGYRSPNEFDLRELERGIGSPLPTEYRSFLLRYGISAFREYTYFPLKNCPFSKYGILDVFFGIMPNDVYDLLRNFDVFRGRMPADFLPIAQDPGANLVCLSLYGERIGQVHYWDREEERQTEHGEFPDMGNMCLIAESFPAFLKSLYQ